MADGIEMLFEAMSAEDQQAIIDDPDVDIDKEKAEELISLFNEAIYGGSNGS